MNVIKKVLIFISYIVSFNMLNAQTGRDSGPQTPLQPYKSFLFGFDTYINDNPQQNQRNIAICSAFNGWLYAIYNYYDANSNQEAGALYRSLDNGVSWSELWHGPMGWLHMQVKRMDLLVGGHDTTNMKLFIGYCMYDSITTDEWLYIVRYDKNGNHAEEFLHEYSLYIRDFAMASDDLFPANTSNPFSFAVVFSTRTYLKDSIIFCSSSNGGISFDNRYKIASSSNHFHKVALAYGRSPSCNSGRYFAAWEEQENESSVSGHIYTAHSEPGFDSPFTTPVLIDSLDPSTANKASNPVISCQNNSADNDSSNLTEVILFEKYMPENQRFDLAGVYNRKATVSNNFDVFTVDASESNKMQPDICFNAFDSTFIMTYFDSTGQKLPYYAHDFNMTEPDNWNVISTGYNDDANLVSPHPQVVMDFGKQTGVNAWIGMREGGNGASMFDSPYTYYTGDQEQDSDKNKLKIKIFPNPASELTILEFELPTAANVRVKLQNTLGQSFPVFIEAKYATGKHQIKVNISQYDAGIYFLTIHADDTFSSKKLLVLR
jgi:hypothetical protein